MQKPRGVDDMGAEGWKTQAETACLTSPEACFILQIARSLAKGFRENPASRADFCCFEPTYKGWKPASRIPPDCSPSIPYPNPMPSEHIIHVERLFPEALLPRMAHPGEDLAFDLFAPASPHTLDRWVEWRIYPHGVRLRIHTGLRLFLPPGVGALVESRSGVAWDGVDAVAGRIDPGYRGPLWVMLRSDLSPDETRTWLTHRIQNRKAIAQIRFVRVLDVELREGTPREDWASLRGTGGFGSTDPLPPNPSTL